MTNRASTLAESPPWHAGFPYPDGNRVAGAGVLVGRRHVVTCVHVLENQLGRPLPEPGLDLTAHAEVFEVEFPFASERTQATLVGWVPIAADGSGDVALLELERELGADCTPAPLACPPTLSGHRFSAHGFPDGDPEALQSTGVLRGASGRAGKWVQLVADGPSGSPIEEGFSGAPVFDHDRNAVVGIVVMRENNRIGHMLPMSYLRTLWPEIRDNCRWRLDMEASYDTHWRPRARGSEPNSPTDEWLFTGRTEARRRIRDWLEDKNPSPVLLVTGGPGSGKSAVLSHMLVSADPLLAETVPGSDPSAPRPPIGAFDMALHLRAYTCDEVTTELARALDVTANDSDELLAAVGRLPPGERFTVLADAVEEAADLNQALQIADLLRQLADTGRVRVLAAVRTAPAGTSRERILGNFGRDAPLIDLEDSRYLRRSDIAEYVVRRLTSEQAGSAPYRAYEPGRLHEIGEAVARKARYNFLIAQLTTGWLIRRGEEGPHPGEAAWEDELPTSVGHAMNAYLDTCGAETETMRRLLTALAYARGDGLPRSGGIWERMADALGFGVRHSAEEREKVFHSAAHYLVERVGDGSGRHTYRLYHDALDQHLRKECAREHHAPEASITAALMDAVPERHGERDWAEADAYTLDHLASHAVAGNQLDMLLTTDTEYLVHASPRGLTPHLQQARSQAARLAAAVYRMSFAVHANMTPAVRRQVLALDAARAGATSLQRELVAQIPEGDWAPLWATGSDFTPALRDTITVYSGGVHAVACTMLDNTPVAVVGRTDGMVQVCDLTTGTMLGQPFRAHAGPIGDVACAVVDGVPVAVTTGGRNWSTTRVWDLATGTLLWGVPSDVHGVFAVACTVLDDIPVAVTGHIYGVVRLWDLTTGTPLGQPLTGHESTVRAVACTVLGDTPVAVTGLDDGAVQVWDLSTRSPLGQPLTGHAKGVWAVACTVLNGSPVAVTGHSGGAVLVWDVATGTLLRQFLTGHSDRVRALACAVVDDTSVAVTTGFDDETVQVWDLATGTLLDQFLTAHTIEAWSVACTALDGSPVALTGGDDEAVRVWDLSTRSPLGQPLTGHTSTVRAAACTVLNGRPVAVTGDEGGTARVRDLATGALLGQPLTSYTQVWAMACTVLDGSPVAVTGHFRGMVRVWDLTASALLDEFPTAHDGVTAVACTVLDELPVAITASSVDDETVQVWFLDGVLLDEFLAADIKGVNALACTVLDDTKVVVIGGGDGTVRAWDLTTGAPFGQPFATHPHTVWAMACTVLDDGPVAITSSPDNMVRVWDLTTGTSHGQPLPGHMGGVSQIACTVLDNIPVAVTVGERDNAVRLWNLRTREAAGLIAAPTPGAVALTDEGDLVVCMSNDVAVFRRRPAHTRR